MEDHSSRRHGSMSTKLKVKPSLRCFWGMSGEGGWCGGGRSTAHITETGLLRGVEALGTLSCTFCITESGGEINRKPYRPFTDKPTQRTNPSEGKVWATCELETLASQRIEERGRARTS